ncbi:DUF6308 family protein [Angustibacter aerolatus]
MGFRLPPSLLEPHDDDALAMLRAYYGPSPDEAGFFTGSLFDTWDTSGGEDPDVLTADDLFAVGCLSVTFDAACAHALLVTHRGRISELLRAIGPDQDLADTDEPLTEAWPAWQLFRHLDGIPGIGRTKASKLMARKRPRLVPIYDRVVGRVTATKCSQWAPLRAALQQDDFALVQRLRRLRRLAGLSPRVTVLRVLDVIAWMDGDDGRRNTAVLAAKTS